MEPFIFPRARFEAAEDEIERVLALTGIEGGAVLDIGCGPGRHSVALAKRGFEVTGVDVTPCLLRRAKELARSEGLEVEWILADMREFVRPAGFDLVISMFTSFGYFDTAEENERVLGNFRESLRPGGACVVDVIGKEVLARVFEPTAATTLEGSAVVFERREVARDWSRMHVVWTLVDGDRATHFELDHAIYSAQELKDRLRHAGFSSVACHGNFDGDRYGPDAQRLVALAR